LSAPTIGDSADGNNHVRKLVYVHVCVVGRSRRTDGEAGERGERSAAKYERERKARVDI
jgi:hypothetical protein